MAIEIRVPTLGESISEATVGKWFKKAGEPVRADEPLVELETDKVTLEVNAPGAGVLSEITAETGQTVAIGALLGQLSGGAAAPAAAPAPAAQKAAPAPAAAMPPAPSPAKIAAENRIDLAGVAGKRQAGPGAEGRRARGRCGGRRLHRLRRPCAGSGARRPRPAPRRPTTARARSGCG